MQLLILIKCHYGYYCHYSRYACEIVQESYNYIRQKERFTVKFRLVWFDANTHTFVINSQ